MDIHYHIGNPIPEPRFEEVWNLFSASLPANELRTYSGQRRLLEHPSYHLLVRTGHTGHTVAAMAAWEFPSFRFIEHFAVDPSLRGQGTGGFLLDQYTKTAPSPVILEVEPPDTHTAARRIDFYKRHGFHTAPFAYQQLPLREGDSPAPLLLMQYPIPLNKTAFEQVRDILYQEVYGKK